MLTSNKAWPVAVMVGNWELRGRCKPRYFPSLPLFQSVASEVSLLGSSCPTGQHQALWLLIKEIMFRKSTIIVIDCCAKHWLYTNIWILAFNFLCNAVWKYFSPSSTTFWNQLLLMWHFSRPFIILTIPSLSVNVLFRYKLLLTELSPILQN